ncbi:excinuclease ABC subunit UvrB [Candidatus Uhrbacteria bacterium]|nr:excinuclease ABC subunit UvrB [Candidatus Uhrbacteria bacterium]
MPFQLTSDYQPAGDQPKAIRELTEGLQAGARHQTLLGVTGSGKTFTMANVIQHIQRPTLVIAHNKTLAAQLCNEFREFFPHNAVEYFVSYYDYYQPEAYLPRTDTYIEKEAMINQEIDRLRHAATQALLSREDVIIVSSVSCIYGLGSPKEYEATVLHLTVGDAGVTREEVLHRLVDMQFERTTADVERGHFRARGDVIEVMPVNEERLYRIQFDGGRIGGIQLLDGVSRREWERPRDVWIFPAKHYVVSPLLKDQALRNIERELGEQLAQFDAEGKLLEAERLKRRTRYDLEMIREVGSCNGIENYSRHFDGRAMGDPPFTLLDYFPKDFVAMIDESHVTIPQVGGMYEGDQARKRTLVEHGFRLPSARDNRPLTFAEFEARVGRVIFTSATPGPYERAKSSRVVEQNIRPTGLVDPEIDVRPVTPGKPPLGSPLIRGGNAISPLPEGGQGGVGAWGQVDDLIGEIKDRVARNERTLVTTLTKKMAEDLSEFLREQGVKVQNLHSDVETLDRSTNLTEFRKGTYDVLVGVNLLREGLDLPEVTLVAILDADKEGFLRSETSLIQTIGRAARNVLGRVILYADNVTGSLERALRETNRRREIQLAYNKEHGITPKTVEKKISDIRDMFGGQGESTTEQILKLELTADTREIEEVIRSKEYDMKEAARHLDFETAAILRDEIALLQKELDQKTKKSTVPKKRKKDVPSDSLDA